MRIVLMLGDKATPRANTSRPKSAKGQGTKSKAKPIEIDGTMYATSGTLKSTSNMRSSSSRRSSTKRKSRTQSKSLNSVSLNKSVTWGGMESYGYAAVMDTFPGAGKSSQSHKSHKMEEKNTTWSTGTLGSGQLHAKKREYTSMEYVQDVKTTYSKRYSVYQEFTKILSEIKDPDSDKVEIVKRIVTLFEGYPHLIEGFNFFLPSNIVIEVQEDAVVVKVDEDIKKMSLPSDDDDDDDEDTPTMRYIRNVKWTYSLHPEVYPKFSKILKSFHNKTVDEVDTIHYIVALFRDHPDLVLGFNFFLPEGYKVLADKKHGYVIQHPTRKGMKPHCSPVNVDDLCFD